MPIPPAGSNLLVVDVGNTRIKWGLCDGTAVLECASLPPDDARAWARQLECWQLTCPMVWAVSGVHPQRRDALADWLKQRGDTVHLVTSPKHLPLEIDLPHPDKVGIDRLLNAVAVNWRRPAGAAAIIIDAGSAITVDYVNQRGVFLGGAIMPGLRLMAQALHHHTALLPLIDVTGEVAVPANNTVDAMKAGIFSTVVGGVRVLTDSLKEIEPGKPAVVYLGGGDAALLRKHIRFDCCLWPLMTLEGLRIAAS